MRTLIRSLQLSLMLLAVLSLSSCEKNSENKSKGTAKFSIGSIEASNQTKSALTDTALVSYQVMVSVEDTDGNPVLTDELIPVYIFGAGFVSEEVELVAGNYNLTKFMVIDPSGEVIFAAPVEGAPLAYLVDDPLPVGFSIKADIATSVAPEVLPVDGHTPGDFGYVSFGIQVVKPLGFYAICIIDNPLSMAPAPLLTNAKLTVFAGENWRYSFRLEAALNSIIIRGGYETYLFLLEKEGYLSQRFYITARELRAATRDNPLVLKIPWDSNQWKVMVLQPGPDRGKDAMISNLEPDKNFGGHKYFEATFISEPVLTVMRSNNSLVWFNLGELPKSAAIKKVVLRLSYDIPLPWDSTIYTAGPEGGLVWYGGVFQQITEPWEEATVTWNNKPKTVTSNQVLLSPFIRNVNFIDIDVTRLYVPSVTTDNVEYPNYGIYFRLWPGEWLSGFRFASSDYPTERLRPQLTVYYTTPN
ncbi:MAG TPA: DNRLRE domain-containing protein [Bacteroidales bacterium]|nr:DNRLRE domain-containing protein [Bacteroidales bacterium]